MFTCGCTDNNGSGCNRCSANDHTRHIRAYRNRVPHGLRNAAA
jgi:hypothetical protein